MMAATVAADLGGNIPQGRRGNISGEDMPDFMTKDAFERQLMSDMQNHRIRRFLKEISVQNELSQYKASKIVAGVSRLAFHQLNLVGEFKLPGLFKMDFKMTKGNKGYYDKLTKTKRPFRLPYRYVRFAFSRQFKKKVKKACEPPSSSLSPFVDYGRSDLSMAGIETSLYNYG